MQLTSHDMSDEMYEQLILDAKSGSIEALGTLLAYSQDYLVTMIRDQIPPDLQSKEGGSDLVQDTFLDAQQSFAQFHGTTMVELRAWLHQILQSNLLDFINRFRHCQKRNVRREVALDRDVIRNVADHRDAPDAEAIKAEQMQRFWEAEASLDDKQRVVVFLHTNRHMTYKEVARVVDCTPDAARKLLMRAMRILAATLKPPKPVVGPLVRE